MIQRPPLRYHGGKWRLAPWIISHFPAHKTYVEPFGGGASVLVRKQRSYAEVYNDLDSEIVNLFACLRDRGPALLQQIALTPYAREEFDLSYQPSPDPLEQARRTLIRSFMGHGGNLTRLVRSGSPERTGFRSYSKPARRSTPARDWSTWPDAALALVERFRGVIIENRDATAVMRAHDGAHALHYVDPPYLPATRCDRQGYRHELSESDHRQLAVTLRSLSGYVVLSGYASELYDHELYSDWTRIEKQTHADGALARTEVLWIRP